MLWTLTSCSRNSSDALDSFGSFLEEWDLLIYQKGVCPTVTDAVIYPKPWTKEVEESFFIPDETVQTMSTCGLLETLMTHPQNFTPWFATSISSEMYIPAFTIFNENLWKNNVAVELFKRDDFFTVLASKYLSLLKVNRDKQPERVAYLEILLVSDMCMDVLNEREKYQLVAMALERMKYDTYVIETRHIMAVIMRDFNYTPLLEEVEKKWYDPQHGYLQVNFWNEDGTKWLETHFGYIICIVDIVEKHAEIFLKNKILKNEYN